MGVIKLLVNPVMSLSMHIGYRYPMLLVYVLAHTQMPSAISTDSLKELTVFVSCMSSFNFHRLLIQPVLAISRKAAYLDTRWISVRAESYAVSAMILHRNSIRCRDWLEIVGLDDRTIVPQVTSADVYKTF